VHSYDTTEEIPMKNGEVDCYIMKGAKKNVASTYAWNYSNTYGGYIQAVAERYIRRKFPDFIERSKQCTGYGERQELLREFRQKHYDIIHKTVMELGERYYLHGRTRDSVMSNFALFEAWIPEDD